MTGYQFRVTCVGCGHPLAHRADGVAYPHHTKAVADCTHCGSAFIITVVLQTLTGPAIRESLPPATDVVCRNPDAPGAALINALMAADK